MSNPFDYDNMSREELLALVKQHFDALLRLNNVPPVTACPFCWKSGFVSNLKCQMRGEKLGAEWHEPITKEEYEAYAIEMMKKYPVPSKESK